MTSAKEQYSELLAMTKAYLLNTHALTDRILSEPETYSYFRTYALQRQEVKKTSSETTPVIAYSSSKPLTSPSPPPSFTPKQPPPLQQTPANQIPEAKKTTIVAPKLVSVPTEKTTPAAKNTNVSKENGPFKLELPGSLQSQDFSDLRKIIQDKLPNLRLIDSLPDDTVARNLANLWAQEKKIPQVLILSFDETPKHLAFLANIAKTLEVHGTTASVSNAIKLEQNGKWNEILQSEELKIVIASGAGFYNLPDLQKNHKEDTKQGRHYLGNRLLLLLSDISFYLKEPALKPSLWGALKELLALSSKNS